MTEESGEVINIVLDTVVESAAAGHDGEAAAATEAGGDSLGDSPLACVETSLASLRGCQYQFDLHASNF